MLLAHVNPSQYISLVIIPFLNRQTRQYTGYPQRYPRLLAGFHPKSGPDIISPTPAMATVQIPISWLTMIKR